MAVAGARAQSTAEPIAGRAYWLLYRKVAPTRAEARPTTVSTLVAASAGREPKPIGVNRRATLRPQLRNAGKTFRSDGTEALRSF